MGRTLRHKEKEILPASYLAGARVLIFNLAKLNQLSWVKLSEIEYTAKAQPAGTGAWAKVSLET